MVSKASEDLPEPERPVITTRRSRGISRSMFLRLCSRAPLMTIRSAILARSSRLFRRFGCPRAPPGNIAVHGVPGVLNCREHARAVRRAATRYIICRAVVGRGAEERQAQRDIHRALELQGLERDQPLVMIHRDRRVEIELPRR